MKLTFTILLFTILLAVSGMAQSPEKISYQSVIRDADNKLLKEQAVGIQISILHGSITGPSVYIERQSPTTNAFGMVSLKIGTGATNDDFSAINWANGPYFIKTEIDFSGGTSYTTAGTSQFLSTPYALHAKTAERVLGIVDGSVPVYSIGEIVSLTPDAGDVVFNSSQNFFQIFNGSSWQSLKNEP